MALDIIASIPKGKGAEIRIVRDYFKRRYTIDIRVWFQPKAGGEMIRSKRGIQFGEKLLAEVIAGLQDAAKGQSATPARIGAREARKNA